MATKNGTTLPTQTSKAFLREWAALANGDDGDALSCAQYTEKSAQVVGTFGVGGAVQIEGSNNGTDWSVLTDPQGNALTFTGAKIEMVAEATMYIRPRVTAGDGTTSLTCILMVKE